MKHVLWTSAIAVAAAISFAPAQAADYTETFDNAPLSNYGYATGEIIPGTALQVVSAPAYIGSDTVSGHGNYLDLASGWYAWNYDNATDLGSTTVQSVSTFDLIAGTHYTLSFDYSRQTFSAGNGPFPTSLTGSLGSHSVTYNDVAGFYYGFDWQTGGISWTQPTTELGQHVVFTASAPAGYSGMLVDSISMVGLAPVPEPASVAMMLAGLGAIALGARGRAKPMLVPTRSL